MSYELHLRHYSRDGVTVKNAVLQPLWARFTESVYGDEPLVFGMDLNHPQIGTIEEFDIFEVMLRNIELGITDFVQAFVAIQRHQSIDMDDDGTIIVTFTAPNEKHALSWRSILWYAGVNDRSAFAVVKAETIMKTIVKYNATSFATVANGRQREGNLATAMGVVITIAADLARGNNLSIAFMGANLLTTLQKITEQGGGDFSFRWQGGTAWTFEFYPGQLGSDKSTGVDRVVFSTAPGNNTMANPRLIYTGAGATAAVAAGKDSGTARAIDVVLGPDYAADYDIEEFVDARNEDTSAGRIFRGGVRLEETRPREELQFDVLQTANQFYSPVAVAGRKTYRAGDLVLATYVDERVRKIDRVEVNWEPPERGDAFTVSVVTREVPGA